MKQLPVLKNKLVKLPLIPPENAPQDAQFRVLSEEDEGPRASGQMKIVFNKALASRDLGMLLIGFILCAMLAFSFYLDHKATHNCQRIQTQK